MSILPTAPGGSFFLINSAFFEADLARGLDKGWILISAGFVFLMQIGLGLMEIGSIRRKNSRIVWWKILLNIINCIFWWWVLGFAWAFGDSFGVFLGAEKYYAGDEWNTPLLGAGDRFAYITQFSHWVWRVAIASIATTIATAIVTERVTMKAVVIFNIFMNLIILPFVFAWTFAIGYLFQDIGYADYAGAFIIFGVGAVAGFIGLLFAGPRYNRYGTYPLAFPLAQDAGVDNRNLYSSDNQRFFPPSAFAQSSYPPGSVANGPVPAGIPAVDTQFNAANIVAIRKRQDEEVNEHFGVTDFGLVCLGALIVFIGFIFFNAGASQGLAVTTSYTSAEVAAANTLLAAMGGAFTALFIILLVPQRKRTDRQVAVTTARGLVAGMVACAASANSFPMWCGFLIGVCGALGYLFWAYIFYTSRLDDPTEFFSIFCGAGISGIIAAAFLSQINGIWWNNATEGEFLLWQFLGLGILIGWTAFVATIGWGFLYLIRQIRVGLKNEIVGYDYIDGGRHLNFRDLPVQTAFKANKVK